MRFTTTAPGLHSPMNHWVTRQLGIAVSCSPFTAYKLSTRVFTTSQLTWDDPSDVCAHVVYMVVHVLISLSSSSCTHVPPSPPSYPTSWPCPPLPTGHQVSPAPAVSHEQQYHTRPYQRECGHRCHTHSSHMPHPSNSTFRHEPHPLRHGPHLPN